MGEGPEAGPKLLHLDPYRWNRFGAESVPDRMIQKLAQLLLHHSRFGGSRLVRSPEPLQNLVGQISEDGPIHLPGTVVEGSEPHDPGQGETVWILQIG